MAPLVHFRTSLSASGTLAWGTVLCRLGIRCSHVAYLGHILGLHIVHLRLEAVFPKRPRNAVPGMSLQSSFFRLLFCLVAATLFHFHLPISPVLPESEIPSLCQFDFVRGVHPVGALFPDRFRNSAQGIFRCHFRRFPHACLEVPRTFVHLRSNKRPLLPSVVQDIELICFYGLAPSEFLFLLKSQRKRRLVCRHVSSRQGAKGCEPNCIGSILDRYWLDPGSIIDNVQT